MKKKYSLSIADVELNVTVDESPETVEYIVGVIDRKMRDILLKSKYCPKTQAALLCALDLCADKVKAKEEIDRLEDEIETLKASLKASDDKYARAQGISIALEGEKARLEIENMKLRALLDEAKQNGEISESDVEALGLNTEAAPAQAAVEPEEEKKSQKSRVGSMFDLLTFDEI
jgi:cell division protein ZapA (FtsZ GTPase activity inhibitor)